ncbi:unnamed protein product [Polarella glacialis]|uniref:Endonuclease/exonuclease/phosphatase domain-containing protein n=1 Tax=Polarella glacialis TaxID=89957 RepID=A0A813K6V6_POLGL|nr:unnamed protein product [Polarella glacialis]
MMRGLRSLNAGSPAYRRCSFFGRSHRNFCVASHDGSGRHGWRLGCWNQHRVGSYAQRDCPWIGRLKELGMSRHELDQLLVSLQVDYEASEVKAWAAGCDLLALQEVDTALREVLATGEGEGEGEVPGGGGGRSETQTSPRGENGQLLESGWHIDGRGVRVDSTVGLFLPSSSRFQVLQQAHCELRVPLAGGQGGRAGDRVRYAARDHLGLLLRDGGSGKLLVACSVHLHQPSSAGGGEQEYLDYLRPLKVMLQGILTSPEISSCGVFDIALLGDFNVAPSDFSVLTSQDVFWQGFSAVSVGPEGEPTAFRTNPCETGDFMLVQSSGDRAWSGSAQGPADFSFFETFCDDLVADASARLPLLRAQVSLSQAAECLARAMEPLQASLKAAAESHVKSPPPPPPKLMHSSASAAFVRPPPPPPPLRLPPDEAHPTVGAPPSGGLAELVAVIEHKTRPELERCREALDSLRSTPPGSRLLKKGLVTSDHRPLLFESS